MPTSKFGAFADGDEYELEHKDLVFEMNRRPEASAVVKGSADFRQLTGTVDFYQTGRGVLVVAKVTGLPTSRGPCRGRVFGFHMHEGNRCTGTSSANGGDPFADTGGHYNPGRCPHPHHAGDFPPLFENNGYAYLAFLTNRFTVREVIGRTVVIHSRPDDFTTQPAGNSGLKIACGVIQPVGRR